MELKVLTLNVWGLRYISKDLNVRLNALGDLLAQSDYDIVGLQELWVEENYLSIKEKVKDVLPYSHRFICGLLGTGCATFSKYPIIDTVFQKYLFNGHFWDLTHGDWYAGKGMTGTIIKHPKKTIHFFNTHMHANYDFQSPSQSFIECRTAQAYQSIQFIRHVTRPSDAIIVTGDFNHETHEIGMIGFKKLMSLRDTFDIAQKKEDKECFTLNTTFNKVYNDPREPNKRIDLIYVNDFFDCTSCALACQKIPGTDLHYSDHEGFTATLKLNYEKSEVDHSQMEDYKTLDFLQEVHDTVKAGQVISDKIPWNTVLAIALLFCVVIVMPLFSCCESNCFTPPNRTSGLGKVFFGVQLVVTVVSAVFVWMMVRNRKSNNHSFRNIAEEIAIKIARLNTMNGKKTD